MRVLEREIGKTSQQPSSGERDTRGLTQVSGSAWEPDQRSGSKAHQTHQVAGAIRVGLKKAEKGCYDCARGYFDFARAHGASPRELIAAVDASDIPDKTGLNRRTFLKYLGLIGGLAAADVSLSALPALAATVDKWGVDSAAAVNETRSCSSKTLAEHVIADLGTPDFWGRYFNPAPYPLQSGEANHLNAKGIPHLLPLTFPDQSRLATSGTTGSDYGTHDANVVCNHVTDAINSEAHLDWPTNPIITIWLDCEGGTNLTHDYWNAWQATVNAFLVSGHGLPFLPGIYMNPNDGQGTCNIVNNTTYPAHGIWTNQPQDSSGSCPDKKPTFNGDGCSGVPTILWQHATENTQNPRFPNGCSHWCNDAAYAIDFDGFKPAQDSEIHVSIAVV